MTRDERISNAKVHIKTATKMIAMDALSIAVESLKQAARELEAIQNEEPIRRA